MTSFTVVWSPWALERLGEQVEWVAQHSRGAALRLLERIEADVQQLATFPELGPVWWKHPGTGIRILVSGKHVVYYELVQADSEVHVLSVRHGREQEPEPSDFERRE
jgi:plasmid stabilization system protein ParE